MKNVSAAPEFVDLEESVIIAALDKYEDLPDDADDDLDPSDPIVAEVARLIGEYADRFDYYCENFDELPEEVLTYEPDPVIEKIAFEIFMDAVYNVFPEVDEE